jgi:low affinity Fe/Cu permease
MSLDPIRDQVARLSPTVVEGIVNPLQPQVESAMKAEELAYLLHEQPTGSSPSGIPLFTSASKSAEDVDADYSYILRQFFGNHGVGVIGQDAALFSAMGTTTSFNSLMGAIAAKSAYDRYQRATEIGCGVFSSERVESGIDTVRGAVQSVAGATYIPYRPLSMTTSILGVNAGSFTAPSVLGQVTYSLGAVGSLLFGVFYACLGMFFASNTARLANFSIKMWKAGDYGTGDVPKIITFLKDRIGVTASGTLEQMQKDHPHLYKSELNKLAVDSTCRFIKATLKEALDQKMPGISKHSEKECREMAEKLLAEFDNLPSDVSQELCLGLATRLGLTQAQAQGLSFVELLGLDIKTALRGKRNEAELTGYIGGGTVAALKKAMETGLIERLGSDDKVVQDRALEEAKGLIKNAKSSMRWNAFVNIGLLVAGVLGVIATIMNFIPATANLAITGAIWLICGISMLPVDGYCLFSAQNSEGPIGKYDKTLLYISTAVAVSSLVATFIIANVFSMGIPAFVISVAIGVLWLGNNCLAMHKVSQKEKKYEMDHPTLASVGEKLQEQIQTKAVTESLAGKKMDPKYGQAMLERLKDKAKNLSKEDKKALKAEVARRAGIKDPTERQTLIGRHGLAFPKATVMNVDQGKKDLQAALEDCLQNAPVSTLRIVEEMGSIEKLKELSDALKKVIHQGTEANKLAALNIFRELGSEVKSLVDNKISLVYGFGEMYFDQHIADEGVLRAVEKAFEGNRSSKELSMLYDYLSVIAKTGSTKELVARAKELFTKLGPEDKAAVTLNIYNKRAKKASSRCFAEANLEDIQVALESASQVRRPEMVSSANINHRLRILPFGKTA